MDAPNLFELITFNVAPRHLRHICFFHIPFNYTNWSQFSPPIYCFETWKVCFFRLSASDKKWFFSQHLLSCNFFHRPRISVNFSSASMKKVCFLRRLYLYKFECKFLVYVKERISSPPSWSYDFFTAFSNMWYSVASITEWFDSRRLSRWDFIFDAVMSVFSDTLIKEYFFSTFMFI